MSIESLRQYAVLDGEQLEQLWSAYDIQTQAALRAALVGLLKFHQEGDDGAELPREYWSPGYREAVEHAESLVGSNVEHQGLPKAVPLDGPVGPQAKEEA